VAEWPKTINLNKDCLQTFEMAKEIIAQIRNIRQQKNISPKEKLSIIEKSDKSKTSINYTSVINKLGNLSSYDYSNEKKENAFSFIVLNTEFFVPLIGNINLKEEKERLTKELVYLNGFLNSVQIKLSNERFVSNAKPEVIESERKKQSDALTKIKSLEEQIAALK
jgi:valyl-tRNA synthetase